MQRCDLPWPGRRDPVCPARRMVIDALSDEQVAQLDGIAAALLTRLDPERRFAALTYPRDDDDTTICEARLTGTSTD